MAGSKVGGGGGERRAVRRGCVIIYGGPGLTPRAQPPGVSGVHSAEPSQPGRRRWVGVPTKPLCPGMTTTFCLQREWGMRPRPLPRHSSGLVAHGLSTGLPRLAASCCCIVPLLRRVHGLQHARLPCPPLSLGVCSSSRPLSPVPLGPEVSDFRQLSTT